MKREVFLLLACVLLGGCASVDVDYGAYADGTMPKRPGAVKRAVMRNFSPKNRRSAGANVDSEYYFTATKTVSF